MNDQTPASGPLCGLRVLEFSGLGPVPFAGMILSDMGADVVRVERAGTARLDPYDITARGRRFVNLDLKNAEDLKSALALARDSQLVLEGFRPGVLERLGLGPEVLLRAQPRLVIGRMTGWGQHGPLASAVGHDINYLALSGALAAIGTRDQPVPPLNLAADYGGGAMFLVAGVLAALLHVAESGKGQVVDCAMVDGALNLMALFKGWQNRGEWSDERESNLLDGGAPFYRTYRCKDGKHIAVGCIEPQFYRVFCQLTGFIDPESDDQHDRSRWPWRRQALADMFRQQTREEWISLLEGTDACVSPVLSMDESAHHAHLLQRGSHQSVDGNLQAAPAPRFSHTPSRIQGPSARKPTSVTEILEGWHAARHEHAPQKDL